MKKQELIRKKEEFINAWNQYTGPRGVYIEVAKRGILSASYNTMDDVIEVISEPDCEEWSDREWWPDFSATEIKIDYEKMVLGDVIEKIYEWAHKGERRIIYTTNTREWARKLTPGMIAVIWNLMMIKYTEEFYGRPEIFTGEELNSTDLRNFYKAVIIPDYYPMLVSLQKKSGISFGLEVDESILKTRKTEN